MHLSVLVPIYNEDVTSLVKLLHRIAAVPIDKEIVVVDDGSAVKPWKDIAAAEIPSINFLSHTRNWGKGAAIRTALQHARGEIVIIQDADLEYYPEDYVGLLEVFEAHNGSDAIYGVRDLRYRSVVMRFGNWFVTQLTNLLYATRLRDMETCYKMISRKTLLSLDLKSNGFEIEAEISAKLIRSGVPIREVPIRYNHRDLGKKLTMMDGLPTVMTLLECRGWQPGREPRPTTESPAVDVIARD